MRRTNKKMTILDKLEEKVSPDRKELLAETQLYIYGVSWLVFGILKTLLGLTFLYFGLKLGKAYGALFLLLSAWFIYAGIKNLQHYHSIHKGIPKLIQRREK